MTNKEAIKEETQLVGIGIVYLFLKKLTTPFKNTEAYKLKIIDENGNVLRKRWTLKTRQEKSAYTVFDSLIFNIKKMIEKIPGGKSRLATYLSALWLIHESNNYEFYSLNEDLMAQDLEEFISGMDFTEEKERTIKELVTMAEKNCGLVGHASKKESYGAAPGDPATHRLPVEKYDPVIFGDIKRRKGLNMAFSEMYDSIKEQIANVTGAGVATDIPFKSKEKQKEKKYRIPGVN